MALGIASSACSPKAPTLPSATGTPFAGYAAAYQEATASCSQVATITASLALSGKAGATKLRGRIDAGFAAPGRLRLEGVAPFGKPVFVLVADGTKGTLVLTRENRVLRDEPPDRIVEALAGVPLGPDALRTIVAGCGFPDGAPSAGSDVRASGTEWAVLTLPGSTAYLMRQGGVWRLAAARRGSLTVHYAEFAGGRPVSIAVRSADDSRVAADIHLRLSDVAINTTLDAKTFEADVPRDAVPMTLDELRRGGPMGDAR